MTAAGSLYRGEVLHRRVRPREHAFRYRLFWILLDLDRLDDAARHTRLFSISRFNLLSFHPRDHGDGSATALREQALRKLEAAGIRGVDGPIRLLTLPRMLGFVFNPISVMYAHRADGALAGVIYEVTSTFGERRSYVLRADGGELFRHGCDKTLHVSPFMRMDMTYAFKGRTPVEVMHLSIDGHDPDGLLIATAMQGERRPLTDREILKAVLALPFETLKVVAAIHWEALRLWLKGVPLAPDPAKVRPADGTGTGRRTAVRDC
ncbi:MAG: DUF1365 domain-containing protein [Brevundimonas sp.]|nr:DUF1365 domain-containing protein [Brevundimonas sp.]